MTSEKHIVVECSAPAKIIFSGEHSVVNGYSGLSATVNFSVSAKIEKMQLASGINLSMLSHGKTIFDKTWKVEEIKELIKADYEKFNGDECEITDDLIRAVADFKKSHFSETLNKVSLNAKCIFLILLVAFGYSNTDIKCTITSDFPIAGGLGSSAAYSAAVAAAFMILRKKETEAGDVNSPDLEISPKLLSQINEAAFGCEKFSHGSPSGIDNNTVVYGGLMLYKNKKDRKVIKDPLFFERFNKHWVILLVDSNVLRSSKTFIEEVAKVKIRFPKIVEEIYKTFDNIVFELFDLFSKENVACEDYANLKALFSLNHDMLRFLNASHPALDKIVEICREAGCAAKLTGAGGGGTVLCLVDKKTGVSDLQKTLEVNGFKSFVAYLSPTGVVSKTWIE